MKESDERDLRLTFSRLFVVAGFILAIGSAWASLIGLSELLTLSESEIFATLRRFASITFVFSLLVVSAGALGLRLFVKQREAERIEMIERLADNIAVANAHRQVGETLRMSEERYRGLVETSFDWIWEVDAAARYTYVSPRVKDLLGYAPEEVLGRLPFDFMRPDEAKRVEEAFAGVVGERRPFSGLVNVNLHKDGHEVVIETSGVPVFGPEGDLLGYRGSDRDITVRQQAEDALRARVEAEGRLTKLSENVPGTLYVFKRNPEREFSLPYIGPNIAELFGSSAEEISQDIDRLLNVIHPDDRQRVVRSINLSGDALAPWRQEFRVCHPKNGTIWVEGRSIPERTPDGSILWHGFAHDISARKNTEGQMQRSVKIAEEAARAKSQFLANMSHEIRTPMNGIIGMTQLLLGAEMTVEQREYIEVVQHSAETLLTIVNDILDFSKIEAGKLAIRRTAFNLREFILRTADVLKSRIKEKELLFSVDVAPNLPQEILGDEVRLAQVLINLLGNAVKFTARSGEVTLRVEEAVGSDEKGSVRVRFEVADTGIGIAEKDLAGIFDAFSQVDSSTDRQFGGTGLGLAISRRLVEMMGGRLEVKSKAGEGSLFYFTLAFEAGRRNAGSVVEADSASRAADGTADKPLTVLVVEDNFTNQKVAEKILVKGGFTVVVANNGREALDLLENKEADYDVMLLDIQMPVMDGFETAAAVRRSAYARTAALPIIALTAFAMAGDEERCLAAGMNDYLAKPFIAAKLIEKVERWARRKREQELVEPIAEPA